MNPQQSDQMLTLLAAIDARLGRIERLLGGDPQAVSVGTRGPRPSSPIRTVEVGIPRRIIELAMRGKDA